MLLQGLFRRGAVRNARRIYGDPRFTQLRPNLEYFREIYAGLLEKRDERIAGGPAAASQRPLPATDEALLPYAEEQLAEVERMLAVLDAGDAEAAAR